MQVKFVCSAASRSEVLVSQSQSNGPLIAWGIAARDTNLATGKDYESFIFLLEELTRLEGNGAY
jgi:hypothetical protein